MRRRRGDGLTSMTNKRSSASRVDGGGGGGHVQ